MKRTPLSRMLGSHASPRRAMAAAGLALLLTVAAGCSGSSLNPEEPGREGPIRIGLMWPTSGVLAVPGADFIKDDMHAKW